MSDQPEHLVKSYEAELKRLRGMLLEMGGMVETQLAMAADAILNRDAELAAHVVEDDLKVDALERDVEQFVIRLLALRQPMAGDLRQVIAALKMSGDLERVGDYATNLAKRNIILSQQAVHFSLNGLTHMMTLVQTQLKWIVEAIGNNDANRAIMVWQFDSQIDDVYNTVFRELITYMIEDPRNITVCAHLLFIAKNLERIGDHATNVAETIYYAVTGGVLPEARPKSDRSSYAMVRSPKS